MTASSDNILEWEEPGRVVNAGVCVWIVRRVTLEDGSVYEWAAPANSETDPYWKAIS